MRSRTQTARLKRSCSADRPFCSRAYSREVQAALHLQRGLRLEHFAQVRFRVGPQLSEFLPGSLATRESRTIQVGDELVDSCLVLRPGRLQLGPEIGHGFRPGGGECSAGAFERFSRA
jgi:hypothetical protein